MKIMVLAFNFIGSLFPVIFPKNEFKLNRLIAVIVLFTVISISLNYLNKEDINYILKSIEQIMPLTE